MILTTPEWIVIILFLFLVLITFIVGLTKLIAEFKNTQRPVSAQGFIRALIGLQLAFIVVLFNTRETMETPIKLDFNHIFYSAVTCLWVLIINKVLFIKLIKIYITKVAQENGNPNFQLDQ